jgi:hypothetical protein
VRQKDLDVARKSVDCGPAGCVAWVQIRYLDADKEIECARLTDEKFADPAVCQETIEAFKNVAGFSAASFRERVRLIDTAIVACADIDVRPTPMMQAMDEKLQVGMRTFNGADSGAPSHLRRYWLAWHEPLWEAYRQSQLFGERLGLLRGYLAHKVLIMDVVEAVEPLDLDTPEALGHIEQVLGAVSPAPAYGTEKVHLYAVDALRTRHRAGQLSADSGAINALMRRLYPPAAPGDVGLMVALFAFDGRIDAVEWTWVFGTDPRLSGPRFALGHRDHGGDAVRFERFNQALQRELGSAKDEKGRWRAFERVLPVDGPFVLAIEARLPKDLAARFDWKFLEKIEQRSHDHTTFAEHQQFVRRMVGALKVLPDDPKEARSACNGLSDRMASLEEYGIEPDPFDGVVCACLQGRGEPSLSNVSTSYLYQRALQRSLDCVRPAP